MSEIDAKAIVIDGRQGEGGGQVLRTSLSLAENFFTNVSYFILAS